MTGSSQKRRENLMTKKLISILMAFGYFLFFFAAQIIAMIPVLFIMGYSAVNDSDTLAVITVISNLITILFIFLIIKLRKQKIKEEIYLFKAPVPRLILIAVTGIALNIFVSFFLGFLAETVSFVGKSMEKYEEQFSVLGNMQPVMFIIFGVILAPVMEELIFRGGIYRVVKRDCSFITASIISSLLFGIAHANPVWSTYAFVLGMVLCAVYEKYHSITANIILHLSFNSTSTFIEKVLSSGDTICRKDYVIGIVSGIVSVVLLLYLFIRKTKKQENIELPSTE